MSPRGLARHGHGSANIAALGYEPPFEMLPTLDEFEAAEEAEDGDE
jgi:hypothetical protein